MKKGFSLAALTATATIIIILMSVVIISGNKTGDSRKKSNFATEISTLQSAIDSYISSNPYDYPFLNSVTLDLSNVSEQNRLQFTNNGDKIDGNVISLYEIDYEKIGYTNLKYGNKKESTNDVYLVSGTTYKVYYGCGFKVGNEVYYTLTNNLEKSISYNINDTNINSKNDIILFEEHQLSDTQKKVEVKIPTTFSVTSVKNGSTTYNGSVVGEYRIYEVIANLNSVINIIYVNNGKTISTSYTVK